MKKADKERLAKFLPGTRVTYLGSPRSVPSALKHVGRTAIVLRTIKSRNQVVCDWTDGETGQARFYAFAESLRLPDEAA